MGPTPLSYDRRQHYRNSCNLHYRASSHKSLATYMSTKSIKKRNKRTIRPRRDAISFCYDEEEDEEDDEEEKETPKPTSRATACRPSDAPYCLVAPNCKAWEPHEDRKLEALIHEFGCSWNEIAFNMERTAASVRNRHLRRQCNGTGTNLCGRCGKIKRGHTCIGINVPSSIGKINASSNDGSQREDPEMMPPSFDEMRTSYPLISEAGEANINRLLETDFFRRRNSLETQRQDELEHPSNIYINNAKLISALSRFKEIPADAGEMEYNARVRFTNDMASMLSNI